MARSAEAGNRFSQSGIVIQAAHSLNRYRVRVENDFAGSNGFASSGPVEKIAGSGWEGRFCQGAKIVNALELNARISAKNGGGFLYPVFLRGQAYLQLRRGDAAGAEFRKFLDHRGITLNSPLGALAYLGLARAQAMRGDTANSRAQYEAFFTLWKDADGDVPVLQEAKTEYSRLPT